MKTQLDEHCGFRPVIRRKITHPVRTFRHSLEPRMVVPDFVEVRRERKVCLHCSKKFRSVRDFCSDLCAYTWFMSFNDRKGIDEKRLAKIGEKRKPIKKCTLKCGGRAYNKPKKVKS